MHEVDGRGGGRREEGGRSGAWSQGSGHKEEPQSPAARQQVPMQEGSRAGSGQSHLSNLPVVLLKGVLRIKTSRMNDSTFIPLAQQLKIFIVVVSLKRGAEGLMLLMIFIYIKECSILSNEVAITLF